MTTTALTTATRKIVRIDRHPNGPRLYIHGLRVHHGLTGCVAFALSAAIGPHNKLRPLMLLAAAAMVADDAHDFPWHLHDGTPAEQTAALTDQSILAWADRHDAAAHKLAHRAQKLGARHHLEQDPLLVELIAQTRP